ncbi:MAG: cell surface protein SprA [Paludibacteraceae bacterium]|nr:cell surface protein SprA [Paludibacteraceae bacterium]
MKKEIQSYRTLVYRLLCAAWLVCAFTVSAGAQDAATPPEEDPAQEPDSAIMAPLKGKNYEVRTYEDLTLPSSSMDLADPKNIETLTDYDPVTNCYIIRTKVGDVEIASPFMMTEAEYMAYTEQQVMQAYWQKKIGEVEHNNESKFDITDMKFNIGPADKVFGPGGVQLKMQGSAEMRIGGKLQFVDNPALTQTARRTGGLDFDMKIQASVNGKVGDKVNFNLNYNTESSFDFDRQNLKLAYKGGEDDIIQTLEAGNVSMDLKSNLISGPQALFGVKTNLKFGKLKIQALLSQQNSESQTVNTQGGAQMTAFEITADSYDENRHFFLNYFFRDNYEKAMATLPYIASGVQVTKVEVWITNKKGSYDQNRNIIAFVDLGENRLEHFYNTNWNSTGAAAPTNKANTLYSTVTSNPSVRNLQESNTILSTINGMVGGEDFEKIESARLLNSSEYTLNAALGYISLKQALNQDEVLAVAYEYTYGGQVYQVGEFSTDGGDNLRAPNALVLKMLKAAGSAPAPHDAARAGQHYGTWHLMMKNIYSLGATQISRDKFELYIMYRNDSLGTSVQYLPESQIKGKQLLRVMNLDRLNQKNNPSPDGKFDFIDNYTIIPNSGRIIFPVLEPFGSHLREVIGDDAIADKYIFQELYDSTLIVAEEMSEKNKFTLQGKYQGTSSGQIQLGAMNVPKGSVTVMAGGAKLVENVDYTVDYTMGTVTILNQSILDAGTNVEVKLENQSTFSMQRKSLMGAHIEYEFNKDFTLGATIMHLSERPLTTKVNTGMEPLSNTIWGVNGSWKTEFMWLTNALDKIPWVNATQPSSLTINAEFAHLIPGHTRDVGKAGTAYIDDFEATKTNIDVHFPNYWRLASTPSEFSESALSDNIEYGKNRALLAWYTVDPIFGSSKTMTNTPVHLKTDVDARSDHRVRIVYEPEIFPNRQNLAQADTRVTALSLAFYPEERGPYNIVADEIGADGKLTNPAARWGGIMRKLDNTDFERANIEYIEFWLMDPFLTNSDATYSGGDLYIQLGDISEDILKDGKKAYENGLPVSGLEDGTTQNTMWGRMAKTTSSVTAFSNEAGARERQDVGLNGLSSSQEMTFAYDKGGTTLHPYKDYVDALRGKVNATVQAQWQSDPFSPFNDPAGDDYHYYLGTDYDAEEKSPLDRYKRFNGMEGNSPSAENATERYGTAATLTPDVEDINADNTLNEYEKYYSYHISLRPGQLGIGMQHITEKKEVLVNLPNGNKEMVTWYQFKIPIRQYDSKVGSIRNFKSIRFMRIYLTGFREETFLRFATMDLVRGDWRQCTKDLYPVEYPPTSIASLDVQAVNIEENSTKSPVNYILPPGVSRQTDPGQAQLIAQNEQAMVLRVNNLSPRDARAVYKTTSYDMRNYKRLQMFVHAEMMKAIDPDLQDGELTCFVRLGSDMTQNYYEYEIPLVLTPEGIYNNNNDYDRHQVWPDDNYFDFPFEVLTKAKTARNKAKRQGTSGVSNTTPYYVYDDEAGKQMNRITVMGNPTLEDVENIMIGLRNNSGRIVSGEVWVNELRMSEFNEAGGVAAMANAALAVSDIAQLNVAGRLETAGYGSIESNVLSRNMDNSYQLSVSAALEGGRLLPEQAKIQMPLYVSYTNQTTSPEYDPLDTDIKLSETLSTFETKAEKDSVKAMSHTVNESTNFSISNLKVNIHSKKQNMFYDPANFSISASYSKQNQKSPEMERNMTTDHRGSFNYSYNFNPKPWEPFKDVKGVEKLRWIKELNIYYLPQSWSFTTDMHRTFNHMKMRDFSAAGAPADMDLTFSKDFMWNRNVDFKYDLTKNIKFSFQSAMNSTIDEGYYTPEIIKDYAFTNDYYEAWKDTIKRSLAHWGSPYTYNQVFTANVSIPFNRFKSLDWITASGSYNGTYNWNATVTSRSNQSDQSTSMGNVISSMQSWQADGQLNFETLYNKSKYLKDINQRYAGTRRSRPFKPKTFTQVVSTKAGEPLSVTHRLGSETLNVTATDENGKTVKVKVQTDGNNKVNITTAEAYDNLSLSIVTKDPNARTGGQVLGDLGIKFLTMIKRVQVTYRQTNSLVVPGFYPEAGFMGQRKTEGGYAPGFDYAFGFIPKNFMEKAKSNGWLSTDTTVVQPATAAQTSDMDIKITLEPFPNFKIQVNGKRYMANSSSIIYTYDQMQETMTGSFNITQVAIGTAFSRVGGADENFQSDIYDKFLANRDIMAQRVQQRYETTVYPTTGFLNGLPIAGQQYNKAKGTVNSNSADVLIPAFLATYTGRDINKIGFNPFLSILQILPNWSVTYDGLGKLPVMRDHFKSFNITHAYTCKYSIGGYSSYSTWVPAGDGKDKTLGYVRDVETDNPIPSSSYDIQSVTLSEQFSPLIGVNMTMKNSLSLKVEYRKQRNLALNINSVQLTEGHTNELVVGAGYTIKDLSIFYKLKSGEQKKVSNDLKITADVSYKDIKTLLRKMEEGVTQASSGNKVLSIKFTADYVLSSKINLQLYYDHQGTIPLISSSYPIRSDDFGLSLKLMLTR